MKPSTQVVGYRGDVHLTLADRRGRSVTLVMTPNAARALAGNLTNIAWLEQYASTPTQLGRTLHNARLTTRHRRQRPNRRKVRR